MNWVKALRDMSANMTQYRVNARNCEAKRLHIKPYVACECAHVCLARQRIVQKHKLARDIQGALVRGAEKRAGVRCPRRAWARRSRARRPVPAQAGV